MKKIKILLIICGCLCSIYLLLNYLLRFLLVVGTPVISHNMSESKNYKIFICEYSPVGNKENLFDKIWLEKQAYWLTQGVKTENNYNLRFTFKDKAQSFFFFKNLSYDNLVTNFKKNGIGSDETANDFIYNISVSDSHILEKDTLRISFLQKGKKIDKILVKICCIK